MFVLLKLSLVTLTVLCYSGEKVLSTLVRWATYHSPSYTANFRVFQTDVNSNMKVILCIIITQDHWVWSQPHSGSNLKYDAVCTLQTPSYILRIDKFNKRRKKTLKKIIFVSGRPRMPAELERNYFHHGVQILGGWGWPSGPDCISD